MYQPRPLTEPAGSVAADLAEHARNGRLTVYAGAGISAAEPTSLPGAAALARLVADALSPQIPLDGVDANDLIAVADAVAAQPLGIDLLRQTILRVADLLGAHYNYAHAVLGLLLCEGAATVLETNYDDCVERASHPEKPIVVRTDSEMLGAVGRPLLKAHGCATNPDTMLVTQAELDATPDWAKTRIAAQLHVDRVAFIGIGSPADYVRNSIKSLLEGVGVEHLVVVDPVLADWDDDPQSPWRLLLPDLDPAQRDLRGAEEFCDALLRAYLQTPRELARHAVASMPASHAQRRGLETLLLAIEERDAVWVLRWLRAASYKLRPGSPAATSEHAIEGLLAVGALVGGEELVALRGDGWIVVNAASSDSGDLAPDDPTNPVKDCQQAETVAREIGVHDSGPVETSHAEPVCLMMMMTHGTGFGAAAEAEAHRRVTQARGNDVVPAGSDVVVVAVGHIGPMSAELAVERGHRLADVLARAAERGGADGPPEDLLAGAEADHLIDGVNAGNVVLVNGSQLIEAA